MKIIARFHVDLIREIFIYLANIPHISNIQIPLFLSSYVYAQNRAKIPFDGLVFVSAEYIPRVFFGLYCCSPSYNLISQIAFLLAI